VDRTHRPSVTAYSVVRVKPDHFFVAAIVSLAVVLTALAIVAVVTGGQ
jgi:hypothetical protein